MAFLTLCTVKSFAQANFLSNFGQPGVLLPVCLDYRMLCNTTPAPSSFSHINPILDPAGNIYPFTSNNVFMNSVYDNSGEVLFSMDVNGIYGASGALVYDFTTLNSDYTLPAAYIGCGSISAITAGSAMSDIYAVPIPCKPYSYYLLFWMGGNDFTTTHWFTLMAVEVDIDISQYPLDPAYTFIATALQNSANATTGCSQIEDYSGFPFSIVVDAANSDNSRDFYTVTPIELTSGYKYSNITKWTIDPYGALPTIGNVISSASTLLPNTRSKVKIFDIPSAAGSSTIDKCIAYAATTNNSFGDGIGNALQTFNLRTGDIERYPLLPMTSTGTANELQVSGFEYLQQQGIFYLTYTNSQLIPLQSAFGYASPGYGGATTPVTEIAENDNFPFSDLEINKNGDLLFDNQNLALEYLPKSTVNSPAIISAVTEPNMVYPPSSSSCSSRAVSDYNLQWGMFFGGSNYATYLGNQIRGENYSAWNPFDVLLPYVVSGNEHWTPTSNPVADALGTPVSTISFANGITIPGGTTLTIDDGLVVEMAPGTNINIFSVPTSSPHGTYGGSLVMENSAVLTMYEQTFCGYTPGLPLWGGVNLWGAQHQPQGRARSSTQPSVFMNSGATIKYAVNGILAGNSPLGSATYIDGGGIIDAQNSNFVNCQTSVFLPPTEISILHHAQLKSTTSARLSCAISI